MAANGKHGVFDSDDSAVDVSFGLCRRSSMARLQLRGRLRAPGDAVDRAYGVRWVDVCFACPLHRVARQSERVDLEVATQPGQYAGRRLRFQLDPAASLWPTTTSGGFQSARRSVCGPPVGRPTTCSTTRTRPIGQAIRSVPGVYYRSDEMRFGSGSCTDRALARRIVFPFLRRAGV